MLESSGQQLLKVAQHGLIISPHLYLSSVMSSPVSRKLGAVAFKESRHMDYEDSLKSMSFVADLFYSNIIL